MGYAEGAWGGSSKSLEKSADEAFSKVSDFAVKFIVSESTKRNNKMKFKKIVKESRDWEKEENSMSWKLEIRNRKELDELYGLIHRASLKFDDAQTWVDKLEEFYDSSDKNWELEINGKKDLDTLYSLVRAGATSMTDDKVAIKFRNRLSKFYDDIHQRCGVVEEADEGKNYTDDTPKIYVGTYAKYNDGSIDGKWITISDYNTYEEFVDACRELHSDEDDPEFMVQDFENFPRKWYHEGGLPTEEEFNKINDYYLMDDSKKEAYEVFVNYTGLDSIEDFEEAYEGKFDSPEDFGYYCVDNFGIPDNPEYYIDYEAFGRDLTMDWHQGDPDETDAEGEPEDPDYYYDSDGYQQMEYGSDREVGEQYIDDIGIDNLGTDTLNNYFDYEEYGRTLLVNDFWEDSGYVFREI